MAGNLFIGFITGVFFGALLFWGVYRIRKSELTSSGDRLFKTVLDLVPGFISVKDKKGRFLLVNKLLADFYKVHTWQMIGKSHKDFFHVEGENDFFNQKDQEVITSGEQIFIPKETITDGDGNTRYLQTTKVPFNYNGVNAILGLSTDITAIENSKSVQKENELFMESIFENAPVPMLLLDQKALLIKINKAAKQIGLSDAREFKGIGPGDALGCVSASLNGGSCGNGPECSRCRIRQSITDTFSGRQNKSKVPVMLFLLKGETETTFNFLLSTSYIEINNSPMVLMALEDVTSILRAEKALIESEFRYKQITRAITDYIYTVLVEEDGNISTIHTPACIKITGYQSEDFEKDPDLWFSIIYQDDRENVLSFIKKERELGGKSAIEHRIRKKNGDICWVSNTLVTKGYRKNYSVHYDGIIRDITERKMAEEALENQNKLLNTMLDNLPVGIFMMNAEGKPILANKHAVELMGRGVVADAHLQNLNESYAAYIAGTNEPYPVEEMPLVKGLKGLESRVDNMEIEHPEKKRVLLEIVGCPVYDTNNTIVASLVGFLDITERKNSEIALRESERKLSIIFEYSHIGISLSDDEGNIQYMNPAFCKLLDYQPNQALGQSFRIFTSPDDIESEIKLFNKLRNKETEILRFEKKYVKSNGLEIWVQLQVSCFRNIKGEIVNFIAMAEDISDRKRSIDLLKASEEKFRNIFNSSNDAILITDFKGNILEVNQITLDRSGYPFEILSKLSILDLIDINDKEIARIQLANIKNRVGFIQTSYINKKGEKLYIEIIAHTINYDGREAILMISRDITERKLMQQKILNAIIEAEEKERTFFSQELHDGIGPILSTIKLYLQWIQSPETKSDKKVLLHDALNTIEDAIVSVKEISNKLSPNVLKKFGLTTAIHSFVRKLGNLDNVNFNIDIMLPDRLKPEIETMLYRVFVEAINNSLKYANASNISIHLSANSNGLAATFRDDGVGFELRSLDKASGNGLFNMQNRVETCEGTFVIKSNPGAGTEIIIKLPAQKYLVTQSI